MSVGQHAQDLMKREIGRYGQSVTVKNARTGAIHTIMAIIMDVDPGVNEMFIEGEANIQSRDMTDFKVAGDDPIIETDRILYTDPINGQGWWMRVTAVHGSPVGGIYPSRVAHTVREEQAT